MKLVMPLSWDSGICWINIIDINRYQLSIDSGNSESKSAELTQLVCSARTLSAARLFSTSCSPKSMLIFCSPCSGCCFVSRVLAFQPLRLLSSDATCFGVSAFASFQQCCYMLWLSSLCFFSAVVLHVLAFQPVLLLSSGATCFGFSAFASCQQ